MDLTPDSVFVLDNCAIHHVCEVQTMLEQVGVLVHYLPPYSPDFNPIEEAFSKVKHQLQEQNGRSTGATSTLHVTDRSTSERHVPVICLSTL